MAASGAIDIKRRREPRTFVCNTFDGNHYSSNVTCTMNPECRCGADHTYTHRKCDHHWNASKTLSESCPTCLRYGLCLKPFHMWEIVGVRFRDNSWWIKSAQDGKAIHPILHQHKLPYYQNQCLCGKEINGDNFVLLSITHTDEQVVMNLPNMRLIVVGDCCLPLFRKYPYPICSGCHKPFLIPIGTIFCSSCTDSGWHYCQRCSSVLAPEEEMTCECQDPSHIR